MDQKHGMLLCIIFSEEGAKLLLRALPSDLPHYCRKGKESRCGKDPLDPEIHQAAGGRVWPL